MSTMKNTKKGYNFFSSPRFFVLLSYLTIFLCSSAGMFCSQIHEHCEEYKKGNNFFPSLQLFVLLPFLTIFLCSFSLLDGCFALRFMRIVKNTMKKVTTFFRLCNFLFFYHI